MKDLPQFTPGWDEQMREFHKSFGIDEKSHSARRRMHGATPQARL